MFPDVNALLCSFKQCSPWSCPFGRCTLLSKNHTGFRKPNQLFAVGVHGPSASPMSAEVFGGAERMCESWVGPMSFRWSQIDDGRTVGWLWLWVGLTRAVVSVVVVASSSSQAFWGKHCSGAPLQHVPSLFPSLGSPNRSSYRGQRGCGLLSLAALRRSVRTFGLVSLGALLSITCLMEKKASRG